MRSRELGEGLRRAMEQARLNGKQVAHQLDWSPSWVSRLLSGKRSASAVKLMEFAEFKPVAFLDSETSCLFLERREEIAAYQSILAALTQTALNEGESRELIATLVTELYADREDHDDRA
ncbi:MAG TPA: Scr1 family TA system antitoxin-like transcriptional regulator [Pseudonocardiaceae bacterium]|nr:Scr1 family TA system antitoxin-like transcriptional regulator [Pseudonocardiaceae bacterium]